MRLTLLAATAALFLAAAPLEAATMPVDVGPGAIVWFDLTTTDLAKSRAFYGALLGTEGAISNFNGVVYIQVNDLPGKIAKRRSGGGA